MYGASHDTLGWLERFDRWLLPLGDGPYLVIDAFAVKASRPTAAVQENWYTARNTSTDCFAFSSEVVPTLNAGALELRPLCHGVDRGNSAEVYS